jgi:hypothetical protein
MSTSPSSERFDRRDCFLEQLVQEAGQPLVAPRPRHAAAVRAAIADRTRSVATPRGGGQNWRRAAYGVGAALGAAAATLIVMSFWGPSSGWAEIATALRREPWIHAVTSSPEGENREFWLSLPREIAASRSEELMRLEDFRLKVRYEYVPERRELVRVPADDEGFASVAEPFAALLRGDESLGARFAEDEIIDQRREIVSDQGRTWHDYVLKLRRGDQTAEATIRVNPDRKLPVWLTLKHGNQEVRFDFDYPQEGPADIYALGVPRETKLIDRIPRRELSSILADIKTQGARLDQYFVIVGVEHGGSAYPERIGWRQGDRWRVEFCLFPENYELSKLPPDAADWAAFWREELKKFDTMPLLVCNGKTVWRWQCPDGTRPREGTWKEHRHVANGEGRAAARYFGDSSRVFLDLLVYPELEPSSLATLDLVPDVSGGPPGALLIHRTFSPPGGDDNFYRQTQYWIDPARRHAAVQAELFDNPAVERDPTSLAIQRHEVMVFERFQQSPQGIWYPAIARRRAGGTSAPGQPPQDEEVKHYTLDFNHEMPGNLFKPEWRK